jgi:hypothetical protein
MPLRHLPLLSKTRAMDMVGELHHRKAVLNSHLQARIRLSLWYLRLASSNHSNRHRSQLLPQIHMHNLKARGGYLSVGGP